MCIGTYSYRKEKEIFFDRDHWHLRHLSVISNRTTANKDRVWTRPLRIVGSNLVQNLFNANNERCTSWTTPDESTLPNKTWISVKQEDRFVGVK